MFQSELLAENPGANIVDQAHHCSSPSAAWRQLSTSVRSPSPVPDVVVAGPYLVAGRVLALAHRARHDRRPLVGLFLDATFPLVEVSRLVVAAPDHAARPGGRERRDRDDDNDDRHTRDRALQGLRWNGHDTGGIVPGKEGPGASATTRRPIASASIYAQAPDSVRFVRRSDSVYTYVSVGQYADRGAVVRPPVAPETPGPAMRRTAIIRRRVTFRFTLRGWRRVTSYSRSGRPRRASG